MTNYFDPAQSLNAFAAGAQMGQGLRQGKTNRMIAPHIAEGNYDKAASVAAERGDLEGAEYYRAQYQDAMKSMTAQQKQEAAERAETLARTAYSLRNVPYEQRRSVLQQQLPALQAMEIDPQELMQFDPTDEAIDGVLAQVTPLADMLKAPEYTSETDAMGRPMAFNKATGEYGDPVGEAKPQGAGSPMGKLAQDLSMGIISPEQYDQAIASMNRPSSSVNVYSGTDGGAYRSLSEVPVGQPIPPALLPFPESKIPEDTYYVRTQDGQGFEAVAVPGSAAEAKKVARDDSSTIDTLINDYATLARNKAIPARGNSAMENMGAMYSGSPLGRRQDEIGGEFGNIDNAEARKNIEGLSMNALMKMISMSDVSARAMDSDAEMRAWLSAIKSDNYESALTKLHVLDKSFGSGTALQRAFEDGLVDQPTYQWVTRRVDTDPYIQRMQKKASRYAGLGGAIGTDNITPSESESIEDLLEFMDPEDRALFEGQP